MKFFSVAFLLFVCALYANAQNPQVDELNQLFVSKQFDQAIVKAREILANDSSNVDGQVVLGRSLTATGDSKEAIPHLQFVIGNTGSWRKAWALADIGSCYYRIGEYEQSKIALKACIELNATQNATRAARRLSLILGSDDFFATWTIQETEHIRFHFQDMEETQMQAFMQSREAAFVKINRFFNSTISKKIDFFVWNSREDAKRVFGADLGFARPEYCLVHSHFEQTRGHEMTHVISNSSRQMLLRTGLINEGTAVCFDLSARNEEQQVLDWIAANKQPVNLKDIWTDFRKYPTELTYPLSGFFVGELLDRFGKDKFLAFFPNQTYENAQAVFGDELDKLISETENKFNQ
ncbi:tetratricopeptide repeat protein [Mangrovibacterium diazotrophicum]|uniref:Tetratricopeptide repeat protein n=1 Tax=Mangrovibacterium diazotrophicum TaxID=1261403 RepID=A0A419VV34_9BACT|nr:tetratricopeptide repeat protein [Mangrovibacterium diazotrophicum]RKD85993.1 hypothetical protein BC643_4309 [Mangrovibacterium diazotrophicum]